MTGLPLIFSLEAVWRLVCQQLLLDALRQTEAGYEAVQAGFVPQFIFQIRYPQEQFSPWFIQ